MSIQKLLVANRGEIAVRIFRTCRELGIATVAVVAPDDAGALHGRSADETVGITSYLDAAEHVRAAREAGADAIHPGYGFLAESPDFAEAVEAAGLVFVGPSADALRRGGDKLAAKEIARTVGVPVVTEGDPAEIGFPLVIKAAAGGGGRGMRVVHSDAALFNAVSITRAEALSAFANDQVYMEKFLDHPRHIEFQVLADSHGNVIHLGERDCSMQRRHQKVVEEAPAPGISDEERARMGKVVVDACKEIGYRGAGTFEFLYQDGKFFFIEMNTRVQVEHPVTELVTGIDIVKAQLAIAAGERLDIAQGDVRWRGHAIECRINAEDPKTFVPSPGAVSLWHPPGGPGIRVDSHMYSGYAVPPYYDSLIAKVIAHGEHRRAAIARMTTALQEIVVDGISTNVPLHQEIFQHGAFKAGGTDIHYLERRLGLK